MHRTDGVALEAQEAPKTLASLRQWVSNELW